MTREEVLKFVNWLELNGFAATADAVRAVFAEVLK